MSEAHTVVIVEDDFLIAEDIRAICEELGATVLDVIHRANGAAERILELGPAYVMMDVRLGGKRDGMQIAEAVHDVNPNIKLIYATGSNEPQMLERINMDHPYRVLIKPFSIIQIQEALGL